jgi:hypothetical protein
LKYQSVTFSWLPSHLASWDYIFLL